MGEHRWNMSAEMTYQNSKLTCDKVIQNPFSRWKINFFIFVVRTFRILQFITAQSSSNVFSNQNFRVDSNEFVVDPHGKLASRIYYFYRCTIRVWNGKKATLRYLEALKSVTMAMMWKRERRRFQNGHKMLSKRTSIHSYCERNSVAWNGLFGGTWASAKEITAYKCVHICVCAWVGKR